MASGKSKRGFVPILVAFGIVSMLAAMSMTMSLTAVMLQKKKVRQLNRMEGFYSNELAVWYQYFRNKENLVGENPTPNQATAII